MKKTIAILLVLVIGMVGVWAANVNLSTLASSGTATVNINTAVVGKALFGLSVEPFGTTETPFASPAAFEAETSIKDSIDYTNTDMSVFAVTSGNGPIVGYLHGITNRTAVTLKVAISSFTDGDATTPYTIPLLATVSNLVIPGVAADNKPGILKDSPIAVKITDLAVYNAAPAANYTATVTISVSSV